MRVALLADVHGNAAALAAVLVEVEAEAPDLVVLGGDVTWGPQPVETLALLDALPLRVAGIRGNAERALLDACDALAAGTSETLRPRERWLAETHDEASRERLRAFPATLSVDVDGLGPVLVTHGSPRSDEELVTSATPADRVRAFLDGVAERTVVTCHTHVQYDRVVDGTRLLNPGSVGLPYEGRPGAFWALLGPDVEHRCTPYDLDAAVAAMRATADPGAETHAELLLAPPTPAEVLEDAERRTFAG